MAESNRYLTGNKNEHLVILIEPKHPIAALDSRNVQILYEVIQEYRRKKALKPITIQWHKPEQP